MREFSYESLAERTWDNEILSYIAQIHEHKGRQELYMRQRPAELEKLIEIAKIQSTESSNEIEGIITTRARLNQLVADKTTPKNRAEEEILGYRKVLDLVHESYRYIALKPEYILQLHRDMLQYTNFSYGGRFKTVPNEIDITFPNGERQVLFKPLEPYETPGAVASICDNYKKMIESERVDALILIPCFILDFLCIHPFNDGNGRMSRLLTLLLLYRSGYMVGQYISIEKAIADTKNEYYNALAASDRDWHSADNDPKPFIKYMLGVILACCREFENRMSLARRDGVRSTSYDVVKTYVLNKIGTFTKVEAMESCPGLGSSSVEAALKRLAQEGVIVKLGAGRKTHYARKDS